jgi:hypothetical protein
MCGYCADCTQFEKDLCAEIFQSCASAHDCTAKITHWNKCQMVNRTNARNLIGKCDNRKKHWKYNKGNTKSNSKYTQKRIVSMDLK